MTQPNPASGPSAPSLPWGLMAGVFVAALAIRLFYLVSFRHTPFFDHLLVDAAWHDAWAQGLADGTWAQDRAFFRAPLYPALVSLIYRAVGHDVLALRVVQMVIGAATAAGLAGCGFRLAGRRAALWAGGIAALYGPLIFFDGEVLIPTLLLGLLTWGLCLALAPPSRATLLACAACLGLAAIARPNALVLLLPLGIYLFTRQPRPGLPRLALAAFIAILPALVVTAINRSYESDVVFIASQGGANFYAGNHAGASGRSVEIPELGGLGGSWVDFVEGSHRFAEAQSGRALSSAAVSRWWTQRGLDWMTSHPGDAFALLARKSYFLINAYETPSNRDLYFQRPAPLNLLVWSTPVFSFPWGLLFPLAVAGCVLGWRDKRAGASVKLLAGWFVLYGASVVLFFVNARFRMGVVPVMILLAAYAISRWQDLRKPAALGAFAAALIVCNTGFFSARVDNPAQELSKLGVSLLATGKLDEGRAALVSAYETDPSPKHAYLLGQAELLLGNPEEARRLFSRALADRPENPTLLRDMAASLVQLQAFDDAVTALQAALTLTGPEAITLADLGRVYEQSGQLDHAEGAYRGAIRANPDLDRGYLDLGYVQQSRGDVEAAASTFEAGARRIPGSFNLRFNLAVALGQLGQIDRALLEIDAALQINPLDDGARAVRADLMAR